MRRTGLPDGKNWGVDVSSLLLWQQADLREVQEGTLPCFIIPVAHQVHDDGACSKRWLLMHVEKLISRTEEDPAIRGQEGAVEHLAVVLRDLEGHTGMCTCAQLMR